MYSGKKIYEFMLHICKNFGHIAKNCTVKLENGENTLKKHILNLVQDLVTSFVVKFKLVNQQIHCRIAKFIIKYKNPVSLNN